MTLNSLPLDYPGRIHVLLNHEDAPNIVRDAIILSILSTEGYAEEAAAEMAVHLSSSAFLPKATSETIAKWIVPRFIQGGTDALVPGGGVHIELQLHKENKLILDGDPLAVHVLGSFHERNKDDSSPSDYHNFMCVLLCSTSDSH